MVFKQDVHIKLPSFRFKLLYIIGSSLGIFLNLLVIIFLSQKGIRTFFFLNFVLIFTFKVMELENLKTSWSYLNIIIISDNNSVKKEK